MRMRQDRITLYPVRSKARYPDPSCIGEGKPSKDGTPLRQRDALRPQDEFGHTSALAHVGHLVEAVYALARSSAPTGTRPVVR